MQTLIRRRCSFIFSSSLVVFLLSISTAASAKVYAWEKPAGPIQGKWAATCKDSIGMVIDFTHKDKKASGKVAKLGAASQFGYKVGEEIFKLTATDLGKWVGQLKWRSVTGAVRWDPVTLIATADQLDAVMTTDSCYVKMPRVK